MLTGENSCAILALMQNSSTIAVKIKTYTVSARGERGLVITLPKVWADDLRLRKGSRLDVYRDVEDRLIIQAAPPEQREELPFGAGQEATR